MLILQGQLYNLNSIVCHLESEVRFVKKEYVRPELEVFELDEQVMAPNVPSISVPDDDFEDIDNTTTPSL